MNSIRLSTTFWTHPKTGKLIKRLGLDGVRSLQILWIWVAQNRPDGKLSGLDAEDIEFISSWNGEDGAFFKACLNIWIDETEEGYALHDWEEHQACASKAEERSGKARKAAQQRWRSKGSEHAQPMPDACPAHASINEHDAQPMLNVCSAHAQPMLNACYEHATSINKHDAQPMLNVCSAMPVAYLTSPPGSGSRDQDLNNNINNIKNKNNITPPLVSPPHGQEQTREGGKARLRIAQNPPPADEPRLDFVELREFYTREIRPEGELDGYVEFKHAIKTGRRFPGIHALMDDLAARKAAGVWNPGYEIGLARYLKTRCWTAPIVPRASPSKAVSLPRAQAGGSGKPSAPTEYQHQRQQRRAMAAALLAERIEEEEHGGSFTTVAGTATRLNGDRVQYRALQGRTCPAQ